MARSSNEKGLRAEQAARDILVADGYDCYLVRRSRFGPQDVHGADIVAKRRNERTLWVQVTADRHLGRKIDAFKAVPWTKTFDDVRIWVLRRHKGAVPFFEERRLDDDWDSQAARRIPAPTLAEPGGPRQTLARRRTRVG
jgi:hypothetical protein